jgi:hypothetical protein
MGTHSTVVSGKVCAQDQMRPRLSPSTPLEGKRRGALLPKLSMATFRTATVSSRLVQRLHPVIVVVVGAFMWAGRDCGECSGCPGHQKVARAAREIPTAHGEFLLACGNKNELVSLWLLGVGDCGDGLGIGEATSTPKARRRLDHLIHDASLKCYHTTKSCLHNCKLGTEDEKYFIIALSKFGYAPFLVTHEVALWAHSNPTEESSPAPGAATGEAG